MLWQGEVPLDMTRGRGDFGRGFYVFEDTRWGRQAACAWARRKALEDGGIPVLVRVRIGSAAFAALSRLDISDESLDAAYRLYADSGRSGSNVVVGPVGRNAVDGRRVPNKRLPLQYKFEGGAAALIMDSVIPCQEADQ